MKNFAITGVGGYIAPRHLKAIADTGNRLLAACDVRDSVGILDRYGLRTPFFVDSGHFARYLHHSEVDVLSVCTPNYQHPDDCRMGLMVGADVICEKPLVVNPRDLDDLQTAECRSGRKVYSVLQLRLLPSLLALKAELDADPRPRQVSLRYVTARGPWYDVSWKGDAHLSGGIPTNIGIHLFDMLIWLFGKVERSRVVLDEPRRWSGALTLKNADVQWFLSIDESDLPEGVGKTTYRSITVDGRSLEFSDGFTDLHSEVYREVLAGRGFGIEDCRPAIELAYNIRKGA